MSFSFSRLLLTSASPADFSENVFDKKRIEKWLDFYTFQLKQGLSYVAQFLFNTLELENDQERIVKDDQFIIDMKLRQS